MDDDPAMRWILPVGRSGWAIAAGYLGLFAVLLVPAPFALATGLVALWDIRNHPEKHGMGRAWLGIVAGAIFTALLLYLLLFAQ
jgi:sugar phosphate permease